MVKKSLGSRKCEICGKLFKPKTSWQKYCSTECRNEAKRRRALQWYEKNKSNGILSKVTLEDLLKKPPYEDKTKKIIWAFKIAKDQIEDIENDRFFNEKIKAIWLKNQGIQKLKDDEYPALSFSALRRFTKLPDYILSRYLKKLCDIGLLSKTQDNKYKLSDKYRYEPLKSWHIEYIKNSSVDNIVISPLFAIYMKNLTIQDLDDEDIEDYKKLMKFFSIGQIYFGRWLSAIQNKKYTKEFYRLLDKYNIPPIIKLHIWVVSNLGNFFAFWSAPIIEKYRITPENALLSRLIISTIVSMLYEKYMIPEEIIYNDYKKIYQEYEKILSKIDSEREKLNVINNIDAILITHPIIKIMTTVRKTFNKDYEEKKADFLNPFPLLENLPGNEKDISIFKKFNQQEEIIEEIKNTIGSFNFQKYWDSTKMNKIFSSNYFLQNLWKLEGWRDISDIFIEEFGDNFLEMWQGFLTMLDYWTTIFPPPTLPKNYEDLFKPPHQ